MDDQTVGWIAAIFIGGVAGWLAELLTRSNMGILTNIILGIIGAGIATWVFGLLGIRMQGGWLGYFVSGLAGACLLIIATRVLYPDRWRA